MSPDSGWVRALTETAAQGATLIQQLGGSSPPVNPQIRMATLDGASNSIPFFITANGPVREARFALNPDGTLDGAVHQVFTIAGRTDAGSCTAPQPDFASQMASGNVGFRIPTPLFGLGLVEAVPDVNLQAAFDASASLRASLGVSGHFNHSANDATITRFGWKAQNKSLLLFAGEAYNVEQGVSNELFPNEVNADPNCATNASPEDLTNLRNTFQSGSPASDFSSDIVNFAAFARLSFPPLPKFSDSTTLQGQQIFLATGCQSCHIVQQTTGISSVAASISNVTFEPYSDLAVHDMGDGLADGVIQGTAQGNEFRTAPLWGLGSRLFFLHDGRTNDLNQAILAHASGGSEANAVIQNYSRLSDTTKGLLLRFLKSL